LSTQLRVTRPGFVNSINVLAQSDAPVPHLPSIERWREDGRQGLYDPNVFATRLEMRSFVCGQCHVEYYFKPEQEGRVLTYPWHNGLLVEQIEAYYDEVGHRDWQHKTSGANALKAQHPCKPRAIYSARRSGGSILSSPRTRWVSTPTRKPRASWARRSTMRARGSSR
jgi:formate-dependent nitrite reductase cytochrome c552 subunit